MKKLYKEYTITSGGGTIPLKANDVAEYYRMVGGAVTITSGLTITIDSATKNNVVRIYWLQDTTIGAGGSITILGNNVPINIIGGIMFTCVYNGTTWDIFQAPAENYDAATLELANVAYVNPDITTNDLNKLVFKTIAEAQDYIVNIAGTATTNNHWTIKASSGYINENVTLKAYIDIQGAVGTKIKSVTSNVAFVSSNVYDSVVYDCAIATAYVAEAKTANFVRCTFESITPVLGAAAGQLLITDSIIKSADFSNSESIFDWTGNKFYATGGNILMSGMTHNIKDSEIVAYGANNVSIPDSLINCFVSIPAITTTRATTISGGKVIATTISAGANLSLLNTDVGAADITMATATNLTTNALKTSGTIVLSGTATKESLDNVWNDGVATKITATAWNVATANGDYSTAWNQAVTNGSQSTAWNAAIANGVGSTAWNTAIASGDYSTAINQAEAYGNASFGVGSGVEVQSFLEVAFGQYNTNGAATSTSTWNVADKLFSIGNGTAVGSRDDAVVVYKNGRVNLQNVLNLRPMATVPAVGMVKGDMVSLTDGTLWFYNGTAWGEITVVVTP